jgi:hypothetical protein
LANPVQISNKQSTMIQERIFIETTHYTWSDMQTLMNWLT